MSTPADRPDAVFTYFSTLLRRFIPMNLPRRPAALLLLLPLALAGCEGGNGAVAKLAPVKGRVTFKDQGVTAAEIYFLPDADKGNEGKMASSLLQVDGSFTMTTQGQGDGVIPGAYKVTLTLGRRPEKELDKYKNVKTTPLEYTVPPEGLTDLQIELK